MVVVPCCGKKIRYTRFLVHLVSDDLASGVEEDRDSSARCIDGIVDLVQSTCSIGFVLEHLDHFKGSIATT
jgi:hypothetical protein